MGIFYSHCSLLYGFQMNINKIFFRDSGTVHLRWAGPARWAGSPKWDDIFPRSYGIFYLTSI